MKQSEILPGDVLVVWGESLIEEVIEHVTHGCSHVAIFIDNQTIAEFQGGRKSGISPLSVYLESDNRLEVWRDTTLTVDEREKIVQYALHHSGQEYDYLAIFVELLRYETGITLDYHEGKKRICSTFIKDCGLSVHKEWTKVTLPAPVDILNSGKLTKVGRLK